MRRLWRRTRPGGSNVPRRTPEYKDDLGRWGAADSEYEDDLGLVRYPPIPENKDGLGSYDAADS